MRERERGSYSILELSGILSPIRKEGKKKKENSGFGERFVFGRFFFFFEIDAPVE